MSPALSFPPETLLRAQGQGLAPAIGHGAEQPDAFPERALGRLWIAEAHDHQGQIVQCIAGPALIAHLASPAADAVLSGRGMSKP